VTVKPRPPDADIVRRYRDEQLSGKALAADLGLDVTTVYKVLRAAKATRPRGTFVSPAVRLARQLRPKRIPASPARRGLSRRPFRSNPAHRTAGS
jgi:hypothetical protein